MKSQRRVKRRNQQRSQYIDPGRFTSVTQVTRTYRFTATTSFNSLITNKGMIGIAGGVCTVVNTTVAPIAVTFKMHRIRIWATPGSTAAASSVAVRWQSLDNLPAKEVANTSVTTARPAYLEAVPPQGSLMHQMQGTGATSAFGILCPAGALVEIHCTHWLYDTGSVAVDTFAVAAGTLGVLYFLALDETASNNFVPVGLPTTS